MTLQKLGIDARWGNSTDAIKRFVYDFRKKHRELVMTMGVRYNPGANQLEQYERTKGWLFEDQRHPHVKQVKWVYKPGKDGRMILFSDSDRCKSFLMARIGCPQGSIGSIDLFNAQPSDHDMFASHVAGSEYPELAEVAGKPKELWKLYAKRPDNDWLDCAYNCMSLASFAGVRINPNSDPDQAQRRAPTTRGGVAKSMSFSERAAMKLSASKR